MNDDYSAIAPPEAPPAKSDPYADIARPDTPAKGSGPAPADPYADIARPDTPAKGSGPAPADPYADIAHPLPDGPGLPPVKLAPEPPAPATGPALSPDASGFISQSQATEDEKHYAQRGPAGSLLPAGMRVAGPMGAMALTSWALGPEAGIPATLLANLLAATGGSAAAELPAQETEKALGEREKLSGADASINIGAGGLAPVFGAGGKAVLAGLGVRAGTGTAARLAVTAAVRGTEGAALTTAQDTAARLATDQPVTPASMLKAAVLGAGFGALLGTTFDELARTQTMQNLRATAVKMGYQGSGKVDDLRAWWDARQRAARAPGWTPPAELANGTAPTPARSVSPVAPIEVRPTPPRTGEAVITPNPAITPTPQAAPPPANVHTRIGDLAKFPPLTIPAGQIATRPDLMQFKRQDDTTTGINTTDKLDGKWDELKGGLLMLWEPKNPAEYGLTGDQKYIVANGHHRFEFGQRVDNSAYHSQILREADGYTAKDAMREATEANIADGKGTIYDQAKYIRELTTTHGAVEARVAAQRIGARGRKAALIGTTASPGTFDAFINEKISPDHAEQISVAAPGNEAAQRVGVHVALKGAGPLESANTVRAALADTGQRTQQGDLFGSDDSALNAMIAQAKAAGKIQAGIAEDIRAISGAAKKPEVAAKYGVNVKDPAALAAKLAELKATQDKWASWNTDPELTAQVRAAVEGRAGPLGIL